MCVFVCVGVGVALVKQLFKLSNFLMRVCRNMHTGMNKREVEGKATTVALQNVIE